MTQTARIVKILGGERTLGRKVASSRDLIIVLRAGLTYRALEAMIAGLNLSRSQVLESLSLPSRTMARRKEERRLSAEESGRVYRLARIAARAEEVLGSLEKARLWLLQPNRALGSTTPLSLLDTDEGARHVEAILGRIEHGVFS
jgi:putative toxin-antitoxin system antitoxin component (TIGR02293 family)